MKISESPIGEERLRLVQGCADDAARVLELDRTILTPAQIVEAVDTFVDDWQQGDKRCYSDDVDTWSLSLEVGSLWGEQLVAQLGWEWANVVFHEQNDSKAVGVFSPDRSLAIYPFYFVYGCLENDATVKIMLAFNMLIDPSRLPPIAPQSYANVMDHVHYIIPRH